MEEKEEEEGRGEKGKEEEVGSAVWERLESIFLRMEWVRSFKEWSLKRFNFSFLFLVWMETEKWRRLGWEKDTTLDSSGEEEKKKGVVVWEEREGIGERRTLWAYRAPIFTEGRGNISVFPLLFFLFLLVLFSSSFLENETQHNQIKTKGVLQNFGINQKKISHLKLKNSQNIFRTWRTGEE